MTELTPPGPESESAADQPPKGGLSVDEWLATSAARAQQAEARPAGGSLPPPPGTRRRLADNRLALWAFGLSLAMCVPGAFLVAIALAIVVLRRGRDGRDHGRVLAILALGLSGASAILAVVYWSEATAKLEDAWSTVQEGRNSAPHGGEVVYPDELEVGDCIVGGAFGDFAEGIRRPAPREGVERVECAEPHHAEVLRISEMRDSARFQQGELDRQLLGCERSFEEYVGHAPAGSVLEMTYYAPDRATWQYGYRTVICTISEDDFAQTDQSLRGASR